MIWKINNMIRIRKISYDLRHKTIKKSYTSKRKIKLTTKISEISKIKCEHVRKFLKAEKIAVLFSSRKYPFRDQHYYFLRPNVYVGEQ